MEIISYLGIKKERKRLPNFWGPKELYLNIKLVFLCPDTEQCAQVVGIPIYYSGGPGFMFWPEPN
jgi:hypothetical protein